MSAVAVTSLHFAAKLAQAAHEMWRVIRTLNDPAATSVPAFPWLFLTAAANDRLLQSALRGQAARRQG